MDWAGKTAVPDAQLLALAEKLRVEVGCVENVPPPEWWDESGEHPPILKRWHFVTKSGECELYVGREAAAVFWRGRYIRFESEDYPECWLRDAVVECLSTIFSGETARDPEPAPKPYGCVMVPVFPFFRLLGGEYRRRLSAERPRERGSRAIG